MRSLTRAIDRFCYKHPKFGIRNLMLYIIAGNILVYFIYIMDAGTTGTFLSYLQFSPKLILQGEVWRLVSFIFIPSHDSIIFLALTLYFYYFLSSTLERRWGSGRFTIFYLSGLLLTIIFGFAVYFMMGKPDYVYLTAYYVNMSMFFAFAVLYPETMVLLFFFLPIKVKWLGYLDAVYFLYMIVANMAVFPLNLTPAIAFINFLIFCGSDLFSSLKRSRPTKKSVEFQRAARKAQYEEDSAPYRHKCSVCGRTDAEYPNLEFRYCSRCAGYHCFCEEHIGNHIHFTE